MTLPKFNECIEPILDMAQDRLNHTNTESIEYISKIFKVTENEKSLLIPSGRRPLIVDRVLWAIFYMKKAQLIKSVGRGEFICTKLGIEVLKKRKEARIPSLTVKVLLKESKPFEDWNSTKTREKKNLAKTLVKNEASSLVKQDILEDETETAKTPLQKLEEAYQELNEKVVSDLIERMSNLNYNDFEIFITNILPKLGYGTDANDIIQSHGGPGDKGIDGIVRLDSLGAEKVFIQAKHWQKPVGMAPVVSFRDKVKDSGVKAGVFVALSGFNGDAKKFIDEHHENIAWIDSRKLAEAMIAKGAGVLKEASYDIYRVDDELFDFS